MNKTESNKALSLEWIAAFNAHDLEKLLSLYDDLAVHYSPKLKIREPQTGGWIRGKDALRSWWKDAFSRLPLLQYHLKNLVADDEQVFMEYLRKVPGEEDMMVAEVLLINDRIIQSRVYHG